MKCKEASPAQKRMLIGWMLFIIGAAILYLGFTCAYLIADKREEDNYWDYFLSEANAYTEEEETLMQDAAQVQTGIHVERLDSVDIKNSKFTVTFYCWFNWEGHDELDMEDGFTIYEGSVNHVEKLEEHREDGSNYQLFEVNADISKEFSTRRFPLGSYQLRIYLQPKADISQVVFEPDVEGSGVDEKLNAAGFALAREETGLFIYRRAADADGAYYKGNGTETYSEVMTMLELNRDSIGLYVKCTIALVGTSIWALLALFLCSHHQRDSLGMMPAILIGTVTNLMIGANLVPDALHTGLLEFINIWGIYTVLLAATLIVVINRLYTKPENGAFAALFGKTVFYALLITTLIGHLALPLSAYRF